MFTQNVHLTNTKKLLLTIQLFTEQTAAKTTDNIVQNQKYHKEEVLKKVSSKKI